MKMTLRSDFQTHPLYNCSEKKTGVPGEKLRVSVRTGTKLYHNEFYQNES